VNEKNRKQIILLGAAGAALVGVLVYQFVIAGGAAPTPAASQTAPTAAPAARPRTPAAPGAPREAAKAEEDPLSPAALDSILARIQRVTFRYPENPVRDPMEPLIREGTRLQTQGLMPIAGASVISLQSKRVTGIIGNDQYRYAVVDDEVVFPGYRYPDGVWVEAIERDKVIFGFEDKRIEVLLKE